jgi:hypothetical protein
MQMWILIRESFRPWIRDGKKFGSGIRNNQRLCYYTTLRQFQSGSTVSSVNNKISVKYNVADP